jgi:hypothetical protein
VRNTVASLVLGLLTTLAVAGAMGWVMWRGACTSYKTTIASRPESHYVHRYEYWGSSEYQELGWLRGAEFVARPAHDVRRTLRSATWEETTPLKVAFSIGGPDTDTYMLEWGWPFRSLWGEVESHWRTSQEHHFGLYHYFRQIDANTTYSRDIPYAPIPVGLILDTLIWAIPWWLALFGVRRIRRWNRLRRNRCPHCNYNLAGLAPECPCPECGRPIM